MWFCITLIICWINPLFTNSPWNMIGFNRSFSITVSCFFHSNHLSNSYDQYMGKKHLLVAKTVAMEVMLDFLLMQRWMCVISEVMIKIMFTLVDLYVSVTECFIDVCRWSSLPYLCNNAAQHWPSWPSKWPLTLC